MLLAGIGIGAAASGGGGDSESENTASAPASSGASDTGGATAGSGTGSDSGDQTGADDPDGSSSSADSTRPTSPPTTRDPESAARAEFHDLLVEGRERSGEIADTWVPQLSSKRLGITDNTTGITYSTWQSLLEDFQQNQDRYGDVMLLSSGDWSSFSDGTLYVTVAVQPYSTAAEANAWCDRQGIPANDCFAKYVSDSVWSGAEMQEYR